MAAGKAIPAQFDEEFLRLASEGKSVRAIAEWLATVHGHKASPAGVAKRLSRLKGERAVVSQAVAREHLSKHVTSDLDALTSGARGAWALVAKYQRKAMGDGKAASEAARLYPAILAQARATTESKLKAAGVDEPDASKSGGLAALFAELEKRGG